VGCCLVCLILRIRASAIERRQMEERQGGGYYGGGQGGVYKPTTMAAQGGGGGGGDREGFFSRFQREGGGKKYDDSSSSDDGERRRLGDQPMEMTGAVRQEPETLQRSAPIYDPGTEDSDDSSSDSIKKIKENSLHRLNKTNSRGSLGHPDPLLAASRGNISGGGSKTNLLTESSLSRSGTLGIQNESMQGRGTLPPPPIDLLGPPPFAGPPESRGSTLQPRKDSITSTSDDESKPITPVSPTFLAEQSIGGSSANSSNRGSTKRRADSLAKRAALAAAAAADAPPPLPMSPPPMEEDETGSENTDGRYDGVYYTREPLAHRPNPPFPEKPMSVDMDPASYRPYGRPSQL